jgi:hypothetical protein
MYLNLKIMLIMLFKSTKKIVSKLLSLLNSSGTVRIIYEINQ